MELPTPEDLKGWREDLKEKVGLTQSELAEKADVSQPLIARIESGDVDPRLSTLRRIVNALEEIERNIPRAGDIMNTDVFSVRPDDSVETANQIMHDEGFSQLPVIRDHSPEGIISLSDIRRAELDNMDDIPVAEIMHESIKTVEPETIIHEVNSSLDHNDAVLVSDDGKIVGIITDSDATAV